MTNRELSEKLDGLASKLEAVITANESPIVQCRAVMEIVDELRTLSNEKYTPGTVSWSDIKPKAKPAKKHYPF